MKILALDLETVPCPAMAQRCYGIDPRRPGWEDQVFAARRAETKGDSDFLKPAFWRVAAIGLAGLDTETGRVKLEARAGEDEAQLIARVAAALSRRPHLVTFNGSGFDLPVLRYRAFVEGNPLAALYGPAGQKPWDSYLTRYGDKHVDLADALSGYGASPRLKLRELAALCGLEAKTDGDGSQVLGWWRAGDLPRIERYVQDDAVLTLVVWLRWQETMGRLPPERRVALEAEVRRAVEQSQPAEALA